jgi:hypothetical protein
MNLTGYRTYLCAVGIGLVVIAVQLNWITADVAKLLIGLLGAGGLAALRAALP